MSNVSEFLAQGNYVLEKLRCRDSTPSCLTCEPHALTTRPTRPQKPVTVCLELYATASFHICDACNTLTHRSQRTPVAYQPTKCHNMQLLVVKVSVSKLQEVSIVSTN